MYTHSWKVWGIKFLKVKNLKESVKLKWNFPRESRGIDGYVFGLVYEQCLSILW